MLSRGMSSRTGPVQSSYREGAATSAAARFKIWPEPQAEAWSRGCWTDVLIEIAIAEKRPDEVLRWYDRRKPRSRGWDAGWFTEDRIAEAVVARYPERAVAIWKQLAEAQIALAKPKAYDAAAGYLRKVGRVLKQQGKEQDWQDYLSTLRRAHERKRRLVETLDILAGHRIVDVR